MKTLKNLCEGQKVSGVVKNIKPYGAFIKIEDGPVGLAYIEDLSVARIKSPYERFEIGQKVDVVVKSIDRNQDKVFLSYKDKASSTTRREASMLSLRRSASSRW